MPITRWLAASVLALSLALPGAAGAQVSDYPNRKITFMVGFAPGRWHRHVCARAGAGPDRAVQLFDRDREPPRRGVEYRRPRGRERGGGRLHVPGHRQQPRDQSDLLQESRLHDRELAPIAFSARDSLAIAVAAGNPARTLGEFLAAAKAKPISYGFGGSSARIASEYVFKVLGKLPATAVPYQSGAPALNALLGGHVDVVTGPIVEIFPQVQQGKLRALAVTGPKRARVLPDVPTLREAGLAGIEVYGWNGILAPAKIPTEIALKVNTAVNAVVATPGVTERLRTLGYEPYSLPLADAPAFLKESIDAWAQMMREAGITGE